MQKVALHFQHVAREIESAWGENGCEPECAAAARYVCNGNCVQCLYSVCTVLDYDDSENDDP